MTIRAMATLSSIGRADIVSIAGGHRFDRQQVQHGAAQGGLGDGGAVIKLGIADKSNQVVLEVRDGHGFPGFEGQPDGCKRGRVAEPARARLPLPLVGQSLQLRDRIIAAPALEDLHIQAGSFSDGRGCQRPARRRCRQGPLQAPSRRRRSGEARRRVVVVASFLCSFPVVGSGQRQRQGCERRLTLIIFFHVFPFCLLVSWLSLVDWLRSNHYERNEGSFRKQERHRETQASVRTDFGLQGVVIVSAYM